MNKITGIKTVTTGAGYQTQPEVVEGYSCRGWGADLIVHKTFNGWTITDLSTGLLILTANTRKKALADLETMQEKITRETYDNQVSEWLNSKFYKNK